jgi:hypothetical protein
MGTVAVEAVLVGEALGDAGPVADGLGARVPAVHPVKESTPASSIAGTRIDRRWFISR